MAKKAALDQRVSLKQLRGKLTDAQSEFLNLIWDHYLTTRKWPLSFDLHRRQMPEEIAECLRPLGNAVLEDSGHYELNLVGVLLTKNGEAYENWLVQLLEYLREQYIQGTSADAEIDSKEIGEALGLTKEQCIILGELTHLEREYQSYGHTNGNGWKIRLPLREIQHIPRKGSLQAYHEKLTLQYFSTDQPSFEVDKRAAHAAYVATLPKTNPLSRIIPSLDGGNIELTPPLENQPVKKNHSKSAKIFISHSAQDKELVQALTELLKAAFRLSAKDILCTSVAGHKLAGGADTEEELLARLRDTQLLIGVLTPASLRSSYVLFELGARWGLGEPQIPLVANGATMSDIKEPLRSKNALNAADEDDVHQFIENVGSTLKKKKEPASAYNAGLRHFVSLARRKDQQRKAPTAIPAKSETPQLIWTKLIEKMFVRLNYIHKGGCVILQRLAESEGLKPFFEEPTYEGWCSVTCAGLEIVERREIDGSAMLEGEKQKDNGYRNYELKISPHLLEHTGKVIEKWHRAMKIASPLRVIIKFAEQISRDDESHQVTSKIFNSELSLTGRDDFAFRNYSFTLSNWSEQQYFQPNMEIAIREKFASVPWHEIFASLIKREVLLVQKPLSKEIWA